MNLLVNAVQKTKFSIKDFFSKCGLKKLWIWSHLLKKSFMENMIFCAVENNNTLLDTHFS